MKQIFDRIIKIIDWNQFIAYQRNNPDFSKLRVLEKNVILRLVI